jgi:hypothetical protein
VLNDDICRDSEYGDSAKRDAQPRANAQVADGLSHLPVSRDQQGSSYNSDALDTGANYVQQGSATNRRTFPLLYLPQSAFVVTEVTSADEGGN